MARLVVLILALAVAASSQVAGPTGDTHSAAQAVATPATLSTTLPDLRRTIENARVDLARLRVDKWKANSDTKRQAEADVESLQRNMTAALPALMNAAIQKPASLNAAFKLYRNINVLYDVLNNVAESAGAFGGKDEYTALANDLTNLNATRRAMADTMEILTAQRDADLARVQ